MTDLNKRILSSIILLTLFFLATKSKFLLFLILFFLISEIFFEFNILFSKIFRNNKLINFIVLLITLFYLFFITTHTWLIFSGDTLELKISYFFIISVCIASDIGGFTFGKLFKGRKLTKISPNKTYSGLIGAYTLSIFFTCLIFNTFYTFEKIIILSIIVSSISQMGDLFISYLKRKSNLKDTGKIIPGHGGLLDRFDGIIFALPTIFYFIKF